MKVSLTIATVVLAFASGVFGQAGQSQPQTTQPPAEQPSSGTSQHPMHRHGPMHHHPEMMKKHMEEMRAHMKDMQSRVAKLRTDAQNVQDPATRSALLDDADLWEQMMSQMQMHMQHMQHMMGHEGMHHGKMDHEGMHHMDMMGDEHDKEHHPSLEGGEAKPQ